ncbi:MAG: type II toxin-antitoxin system PemK/MazF family toxin [Acidobacteria bacterium]|nr:type II toxin-antitoxin system PemK/MazF family toxin [Acidobacteriota bacterium]
MVIQRGQVYWCKLDPVFGHEQGAVRPAVVVSSDEYNKTQSPLVAIVPLTKAPAKTPVHLRFAPGDTGLDSSSTALADHARFVDRARLRGEPMGWLKPAAMAVLDRQLGRVLGLS